MTSEDVLASVDRWLQYGARGSIARPYVDRLSNPNKYTFEIYLKEPYAPLLSLLGFGNGGPVILPSAIARAAGREMVAPDNYIGTGPTSSGSGFKESISGLTAGINMSLVMNLLTAGRERKSLTLIT